MPHRSILLFLFPLLLAGCADAQLKQTPAITSTLNQIHLSDQKPLEDMQLDNVQITLTDKLTSPAVASTLYFGEADEYENDDSDTPVAAVALIARKVDAAWKAVPVVGEGLEDAGWKYVGAGPARREVWGVLDTSAGESQGQFVIAHSTDAGLTFTLKPVTKPCKLATVADFAMSRDGHGRVTLSLDTDCGSIKAGLFHYVTTDDGKTWSKTPRYESDVMIRAESVPDDEQPDQSIQPAQTLLRPAHAGSGSTDRRRLVHVNRVNIVPLLNR